MKHLLKNKAMKPIARTAIAGLCLSILALPIGKSDNVDNRTSVGAIIADALIPAAQAAREVHAFSSIEDIKLRARSYKGTISDQVWLGDIYSKNLGNAGYINAEAMANHFKPDLYPSAQRNRIEAYFWYSLAAAQRSHRFLLEKSYPSWPVLSKEDKKKSDEAWDRMKVLQKKTLRRTQIVGPSFWAAEKLFVDVYREGDVMAHYIMAKYYKGVDNDYVVRSNYDAYVWMLSAYLQNFGDSKIMADEYQDKILFSQEDQAEYAAQRLVAFSMVVAAGQSNKFGSAVLPSHGGGTSSNSNFSVGAPTQRRIGQPSSSNQVNWGSDFQAARSGGDAGNVSYPLPDGVDTHHSSRSAFDMGNGYLAAGNIKDAKTYFEYAIAREPYSRSAIDASRQLQALTMSCSMKDDRSARMHTPADRNRVHEIPWVRLQLALKALGYYSLYVDGKPGQGTRRAIRDFQRGELNVDDTGYLTTDQRVELICLAAQDVRDAESQIQLGIMYARGIGLNCNTAAAHAWFQKAADQGHPTALYNLGLMYMEGFYDRHAPGMYPYASPENPVPPRRVIDPDMAQYFFSEAERQGHPKARKMISTISTVGIEKMQARVGVIGCIDYEAEVKLKQYEDRVSYLSADVSKTPANSCTELKVLQDTRKKLQREAEHLWTEVEKYEDNQNYIEDMGQSNDELRRSPIKNVRTNLTSVSDRLELKLASCS